MFNILSRTQHHHLKYLFSTFSKWWDGFFKNTKLDEIYGWNLGSINYHLYNLEQIINLFGPVSPCIKIEWDAIWRWSQYMKAQSDFKYKVLNMMYILLLLWLFQKDDFSITYLSHKVTFLVIPLHFRNSSEFKNLKRKP